MCNRAEHTLRESFPKWFAISIIKGDPIWNSPIDWENQETLYHLLGVVREEWQFRIQNIDTLSESFAKLIEDLEDISPEVGGGVLHQLQFLRLYVSSIMSEFAATSGRFPIAYNWLLTGVSVGRYVNCPAGQPIYREFVFNRFLNFISSAHPVVHSYSPSAFLKWCSALFYYSRKQGALRDLLDIEVVYDGDGKEFSLTVYSLLKGLIFKLLDTQVMEQVVQVVVTICHMASWCVLNRPEDGKALFGSLEELYGIDGLPVSAKKHIGIIMASQFRPEDKPRSSTWAQHVLKEYSEKLIGTERLQMLVCRCWSEGVNSEIEMEIDSEIETYVKAIESLTNGDYPQFLFEQSRTYSVLGPLLKIYLDHGQIRRICAVIARWFGVKESMVRTSPVAILAPGNPDGVIFAAEGVAIMSGEFQRDNIRRTTELANICYNANITLQEDLSLAPHGAEGGFKWGSVRAIEDFESALKELYHFDQLAEGMVRQGEGSALVMLHSLPHPIQALMIREFGKTWPILSSIQEPEEDRSIRKALICSFGTSTGEVEGKAVESILSNMGVTVDAFIEQGLSREKFLELYSADEYDLLWIAAHGRFDPRTPHLAEIAISEIEDSPLKVADMVRVPIRANGRRMLMLNTCFSGSSMIGPAPPRLGLGSMLSSAGQAVVAHIWPIEEAVALAFGVSLAMGLSEGLGYFGGFCFAMNMIRSSRSEILGALRRCKNSGADVGEALLKLPDVFDSGGMNIWGSPAFFE